MLGKVSFCIIYLPRAGQGRAASPDIRTPFHRSCFSTRLFCVNGEAGRLSPVLLFFEFVQGCKTSVVAQDIELSSSAQGV